MTKVQGRAGEPEPGVFDSLEPEPEPEPLEKKQEPQPELLGKKSGARAGAAKNLPAPQPCEKIKSIRKLYFSYSSLGKILSFMVKKNNYFISFIFFLGRFTLLVCGEKNILSRSRRRSRSRVLLAPWSRSRSKRNTRSRSRSRLGKK